jgi:hypothetical protein
MILKSCLSRKQVQFPLPGWFRIITYNPFFLLSPGFDLLASTYLAFDGVNDRAVHIGIGLNIVINNNVGVKLTAIRPHYFFSLTLRKNGKIDETN